MTATDDTPQPARRWRTTRRRLLIGAGAGATVLLVGVPVGLESARPQLASRVLEQGINPPDLPDSPLVWFELSAAAITFHVPKIEMGQGIHSALSGIAADELGLPRERLTVCQADSAGGFPLSTQFTFGSSSVSTLYTPVREAAALVREMLAAEAARQLGIDAVRGTGGRFASDDGRSLDYLEVVARHQGDWTVPAAPPRLGPPGARPPSAERVDMRAKLLGEATYGYDARLPGMLYGACVVPPRFGASLDRVDAAAAGGMPGVRHVVIDVDAGFAGVVADTRARAWAACAALRTTWRGGSTVSDTDLYAAIVPGEGAEIRRTGPVSRAFGEGTTVEAEYSTPLAAHAHLEPLAALATVAPGRTGRVEAWVPTQSPEAVVNDLRRAFGDDRDVVVHVTQLGGSFGRKAGQHLAVEAARLSAAAGVPVHLGWTREQDLGHAFYRPPTRTRLAGSIGSDGRIRGVQQFSAGGDIIWAVAGLPEAVREILGFDPGGLLGQFLPYDVGAYRVVNRREQLDVPCGPWRGLGLLPNTFAVESFVDELAEAAGRDPLEFRLAHLPRTDEGERCRSVLQRAAGLGDLAGRTPPQVGRGIACSGDAGTVVGIVAEVSLALGRLDVQAVSVAVDCGLVVDPAGATLQAQGSVVMGLSSTLREELRVDGGRVTTDNFDRYPILRLADTPPITVEFIGGGDVPHGMGEPVIGPVAAAVANAVRAAGGPRLRRLPLRL